MGSPMWSYNDMCFEADRLLHEKDAGACDIISQSNVAGRSNERT